jgi:hypothetical protein
VTPHGLQEPAREREPRVHAASRDRAPRERHDSSAEQACDACGFRSAQRIGDDERGDLAPFVEWLCGACLRRYRGKLARRGFEESLGDLRGAGR